MEPIGRPKATQMIEPMDTYKVFMMRQDENATPETYQQRYAVRSNELAQDLNSYVADMKSTRRNTYSD